MKKRDLKISERKISFILLSILFVLAVAAFLSHRYSSLLITNSEETKRAQEIKFRIEQLLRICGDIETGGRGYVITGNDLYLEPSNKALANVFLHLDRLKTLVAGDSVQENNARFLAEVVDQKISIALRNVGVRRERGLDEAVNSMSVGEGQKLMGSIRFVTAKMMGYADDRLYYLDSNAKAYTENFKVFFDVLLILIAITVIAVFFLLRFYFKTIKIGNLLLRKNEKMLQSILDNTSSVIFIKDLAGRYLLINRQFEKLFHINMKEITGKTDRDIFPPQVADALRKASLEVVRTQQLMEFEETLPKNGEARHYISVKFPLFDEKHTIYAVCGILTDITNRKQMEKMIKERSDSILDIFNNAPCGYHSANKDGIVIEMNDTELKWLGYTREELIGKMHIRDLLSEESVSIFDYHFPRLVDKRESYVHDIEIRMRRKDGSLIAVICNSVVLYDEEGQFLRTCTSVFDITLRKQAESIFSQN